MDKRHIFGICASGPSLNTADVDMLRRKCGQLITINTSFKAFPQCDHVYACDAKWWEMYYGEVLQSCKRAALWCYEAKALKNRPRLLCVQGYTNRDGLCREPMRVNTGSNSGFQAINLAYHLGARKIILLGYDMKGQSHWHGDHPQGLTNCYTNFGIYLRRMKPLADDMEAEGVEVVNATRDTALEWFKRVPLERLPDVC